MNDKPETNLRQTNTMQPEEAAGDDDTPETNSFRAATQVCRPSST